MQINITARDFGGTEFLAQPHRLHLGAQKAEGVDRLEFSLPEQWKGCVVTLHIRHTDGTLAEPLALDETGCVSVGRSFTGWASGEWMLAAANGSGYTAYTRPGQYDVHGILPTEGSGEELTPSVYEQFIARVMASANAAAEAAKRAASGEANAKQSASEAASSAQQTAASATLASGYAEQAKAAADRAAAYAPSEGAVLSVNGKGGAVRLNALDVWALPRPVSPKVGQLVRVVKVDASTGALTADTISTDSLSGLGSEEKALLLKLLSSASYTDSSARDDLEALKKLWDTTPPTPLPDPDIIPVEKVTLSQHTLELSRGSTADLSASIAPPDATDQTVLWSVSPTDIVSVDAGRVTALKKGSAVVTATSDSKSDSCTVTVTPAVYRIETAHTDSGDIPAWDTYPAKYEFFMPLTAKKAGLLLRSLEFRVKGYVPRCTPSCASTAPRPPWQTSSPTLSAATTTWCWTWAASRWKRASNTSSISPPPTTSTRPLSSPPGSQQTTASTSPRAAPTMATTPPSSSPAPSCCRRPEPHRTHILKQKERY